MFCSNCGAPNADASAFCAKCGANLRNIKTLSRTEIGNPVSGTAEYQIAGSWTRCGARTLDVILESIVICFLLSISAPIGGIIALPFALLLDGVIYAIFGTTFGKWLFGIKVVDRSGVAVSAGRYFYRNLRVWWGGYGLGLPLICLITGSVQQYRILKGKSATYDQALGLNSIRYKVNGFKTFCGVVLLVLLLVPIGTASIRSIMNSTERNTRALEEHMRMKDEVSQLRMSAEQGYAEA